MFQCLQTFLNAFVFSKFGALVGVAILSVIGWRVWIWFNDGLRKCR